MSRLKLPKEHIAGGLSLKISRKDICGGRADMNDRTISIDSKPVDDFDDVDNLIHECLEVTLGKMNVIYGRQADERIYVFDHRLLSVACSELAGTVLKLLKANGYKESKDEDSN